MADDPPAMIGVRPAPATRRSRPPVGGPHDRGANRVAAGRFTEQPVLAGRYGSERERVEAGRHRRRRRVAPCRRASGRIWSCGPVLDGPELTGRRWQPWLAATSSLAVLVAAVVGVGPPRWPWRAWVAVPCGRIVAAAPQPAARTAADSKLQANKRSVLLFTDLITLGHLWGFRGDRPPVAALCGGRRRRREGHRRSQRCLLNEIELAGQRVFGGATRHDRTRCSMRSASHARPHPTTTECQGSPEHMSDLTPPTSAYCHRRRRSAPRRRWALSTSPVLTRLARSYRTTWAAPPSKMPLPGRSSSSTTATSSPARSSKSTRTRSCSTLASSQKA